MTDEIPITWPQLLTLAEQRSGAARDTFLYFYQELKTAGPENPMSAPPAFRATEALVKSAILESVETAVALTTMMFPRSEQIVAANFKTGKQDWRNNLSAIAVCNLASGIQGVEQSADPAIAIKRLFAMEMLDEREQMYVGWAALAQGVTTHLDKYLPFNPSVDYSGDSDFGTNEERIFAHLFRAVQAGAALEIARPAWDAWLSAFPVKLAQDTASWSELLWAARVMHTVIGGNPPETLLEWLRDEIPS